MKKIELNMIRFYRFKIMKNVVDEWRAIKAQNARKRMSRMAIRRALKQRPELSKPLFVIRNILLYKSFEMLKLGVRNQVREV